MQVKAWFALTLVGAFSFGPARAQNAPIATLPFAADGRLSIYLGGRVNGSGSGWWVLDTGASECLIDRSVARRTGLVMRGRRALRGAGKGSVRYDSIRSPVRVELAGRTLRTCDHFGAIDLRNANLDAHRPLDGILGYEFLARYVVRIDFGNHTIELYDPKTYRYSGIGDTVKLEFVGRQPRIGVRIRTAQRAEVVRSLIVDTGSEDFVDDSSVRRNPNATGVTVSTTGLGRSYEAVIGTLDTVRIGRSTFTNVPGVASEVGIVGNGIWTRFVCIFDYSRQRLILEPPR
jgi:predicted aspartyl protease